MYAYGPVPSRRFGRSVGVSPIPDKTCSYSCVYCQLGRTRHLTVRRQSFFKREEILRDIEKVVHANEGKIDFITFVGDGEPTLSLDLGFLIRTCKEKFPYRTAVITNGSLFWQEDVRNDLLEADVVNVTMAVSNEQAFHRMHRPHPGIHFKQVQQGILDFASVYKGEIWVEIMLVDTVNTDIESMRALKTQIDAIHPARTFVMVPTRPPAEPWVHIPPPEIVMNALSIFGGKNITQPEKGAFGLDEFSSASEAIIETSRRHPLRLSQARTIEAYFADRTLDRLLSTGKLKVVDYQGHKYVLPSEFVFGK